MTCLFLLHDPTVFDVLLFFIFAGVPVAVLGVAYGSRPRRSRPGRGSAATFVPVAMAWALAMLILWKLAQTAVE